MIYSHDKTNNIIDDEEDDDDNDNYNYNENKNEEKDVNKNNLNNNNKKNFNDNYYIKINLNKNLSKLLRVMYETDKLMNNLECIDFEFIKLDEFELSESFCLVKKK
eukprot:67932_1